MRRRSAARASRARVWAFSFTSSCARAASHAWGDTTGGVRMAGAAPGAAGSFAAVMAGFLLRMSGRPPAGGPGNSLAPRAAGAGVTNLAAFGGQAYLVLDCAAGRQGTTFSKAW